MQRALTCLVLGDEPPGWNKPATPTPLGRAFIDRLDSLAHGSTHDGDATFVDEFELPPLDPGQPAGWPDYAVVWPDRLWMIELKTERASHRPGQLDYYFSLGCHHHVDKQVDLLYVTPPVSHPDPVVPDGSRYRHVDWPQVAELVEQTWTEPGAEHDLATWLVDYLRSLDTLAPAAPTAVAPEARQSVDVAEDPVQLARKTAEDGEQRAIEIDADRPEALENARIQLRDELALHPDTGRVQVWTWREATSGGSAMTELGRTKGYELRLSRTRT